MQIIKQQDLQIPEIIEALKTGATIVYPTETCYGLGCDATNQKAVDKIFAIKKRDTKKPLLVVAHDAALMMQYIKWNSTLDDIANKYWPGPLTVVAPAVANCALADGVKALDNTIAFRITEHPLAATLSRELERPIVSTSANIAALDNPYDIESVSAMFDSAEFQPDIIIDAGELPYLTPSTIIKISRGNEIHVIRQGSVII